MPGLTESTSGTRVLILPQTALEVLNTLYFLNVWIILCFLPRKICTNRNFNSSRLNYALGSRGVAN